MLAAWFTIILLCLVWLCAFVALVACAPILLTARRERWLRRARRALWNACETVWWLGPRPTRITLGRSARAPHVSPGPRRRAA